MNTAKIVVIGNGGVGKSSLIKKINTNQFNDQYISTIGYNKHRMKFITNRGKIEIEMIDTAGQEKIGTVNSELYEDIDGAIIMFDLTSRISYNDVPKWYRDLQKITKNKNFPTVIVGNKLDIERMVKLSTITYPSKNNIPYIETSIKNNDNLIHIFNELFPQIFDDKDIHCIIQKEKPTEKLSKKRKLNDEKVDLSKKQKNDDSKFNFESLFGTSWHFF